MGTRRWTTKAARESVYAAARYLGAETEREAGVQFPVEVYSQDPLLAQQNPEIGFQELFVRWEPGLRDGPTSARFAVVDFDGDTEKLAPKAEWHVNYRKKNECFLRARLEEEPEPTTTKAKDADLTNRQLSRENADSFQFHQVNVWATLQNALAFFEDGSGLGRPIPYGFDGNRLIVVPHAGYGKNAFYDRKSKSLQFYYFDNDDGERVYTCLSADIINHEFGHAVLDGVRPYLSESTMVETAAFHEFIGDFSAILLLLRNNSFRGHLVETTAGDLRDADNLANIAEQFGQGATNTPYLRTARSPMTMGAIKPHDGPHKVSEVMTAAMFDILLALGQHYREREEERRAEKIEAVQARTDLSAEEKADQTEKLTPKDAASVSKEPFWWAIQAMQGIAIQPLDLLPPVDVTFRDYALAVLRADELANPLDPKKHRDRMRDAFVARGILTGDEEQSESLFVPLDLTVFHDVGRISSSRTAAYAFLDDNRRDLFIPADQDIIVADLYDAQKHNRDSRQLPRQVVLTYIWREDVELVGERFGEYQGQRTPLLCGGTLVLDQNGAVVAWTRKPGAYGGEGSDWKAEIADGTKPGKAKSQKVQLLEREISEGKARRAQLLDNLAARIKAGQVGSALGSGRGLLGSRIPPLTVEQDGDELHFALSPHMRLEGEDQDHYTGGSRWEPSS